MSARSSGTGGGTAIRGSHSGKIPPQRRKPGRVPTACAECRRLKLRCNRQVPCEKCESRGCAAICPDGALTPGKKNRLILANTEELHDQIDTMKAQIEDLERALQEARAQVPEERRPLLRTGNLFPSSPGRSTPTPSPTRGPSSSCSRDSSSHELQPHRPSHPPDPVASTSRQPITAQSMCVDDDEIDGMTACGTLISTANGGYLHLGSTARTEYLMRIPSHARPALNISSSRLPKRIINTSFFDSDLQELDDDLGREIYTYLPPLAEAEGLCKIYLEHGEYLYMSLSQTELSEIISPIYRAGLGSFEGFSSAESISLLFIVFALGALLCPHPDAARAHEYFYLSRAALSLSPPRGGVTLVYIQAIIHMAHYLDLCNPSLSHSSSAWLYAGYAARLGQDIALQLHNSHWELPLELSLRRCRTFWRLFVLDTWTSFYYGRPLTMSPSFIDCPFPKDVPTDHPTMSFDLWNSKFASLVHSVITTALGPKHVPYLSVIELDRRIRDFHVPTMWLFQCDNEAPETTSELRMQRYFVCSRKEIVLLSLHRPYLVQILSERPVDLHRHRYKASAVACYRSAWRLINATKHTFHREAQKTSRLSLFWSHCLSATVVMSLLVARDPKGPMAASALRELETATELFEDAAPSSQPAFNLLGPVRRLLQTAREAAGQLSIARVGEQELDSYPPRELERLAGKTTRPQEMTNPHTPWSLNDHSVRQSRPNAMESWQEYRHIEEDPFQVLKDITSQHHLQAQPRDSRPQMIQQGLDCMHVTLEQDLRAFELGSFCINIKSLNDGPSLRSRSTSASFAPQIVATSAAPSSTCSAIRNDQQDGVLSPSEDGSTYASPLSDRSLASGDFALGIEQYGQNEYQIWPVMGNGAGTFSSLFGGSASFLMVDPSGQAIAEHLGFFSTPLSYSSPWFTPVSY